MNKFDINEFTGYQDDPRDYLQNIARYKDYQYATNGHIVLFEPLQDSELKEGGLKTASLDSIIERINAAGEYIDLPEIILPKKHMCQQCKGTGKCTIKNCEECNGNGIVEFETDFNDYEIECKSCDGDGKEVVSGDGFKCSDCNGLGYCYSENRYDTPIHILNGVHIGAIYAEILTKVGGVKVAALKDAIAFKKGDQFGMIMMMRV